MSKSKKRRREERRAASAAIRGERVLYFAYGSNCNVAQMSHRCPDATLVGTASLLDWRLTFRGCADVEPFDGEVVHGALWLVSASDLVALDRYEGYPTLYNRGFVDVETKTGTVQALTYWMTQSERVSLPSLGYFEVCSDGYVDCGLDVAQLKRAVKRVADDIEALGYRYVIPQGRWLVPVEERVDIIDDDRDVPLFEDEPRLEEDVADWLRRTGKGSPATRALYALD